MKKKNELKPFNFLMLTLSGIVNAVGVTLFLYPVSLFDSGISGTSMLFAQITPSYLPLAFFLIVLNFPLFIFGLKKQGITFTIYSLYVVFIYSIVSYLFTNVLFDLSTASPIAGDDIFLCAIFGGLISGVGSGLAIRYGGAIDGIEVMAVIFAKRLNITVGTFVMIYNVILYVICGIVIGGIWTIPLYSIVTYIIGIKAVDFVVEGIDRSKAAIIITSKPNEVQKALADKFKVSPTTLKAKGGYSGEERTMLYFVVNRFQIYSLKNIVRAQDEKAYITISDVADVFKANN